MCIIAAKPAGLTIPEATLRRCFTSNPDGAGFVANLGKKGLVSKKGFFKFEEFLDAFKSYEKNAAVIHFRIKTHGAKNEEMCHPFQVTDDLWVAHNGIIDIDTAGDPTKSDTWHFVESVLKPELAHDPDALKRPSFQYLLGSTIERSKLAFLGKGGEISLINESYGETHEGVWYSNGGYKEHKGFYSCDPRAASSGSSGYYGGGGKGYYSSGGSSKGSTYTQTTFDAKTVGNIKDVPQSLKWVVDCLRTDGMFTDEMIVDTIRNGTYEDDIFEIYDDIRRQSNYAFPVEEVSK